MPASDTVEKDCYPLAWLDGKFEILWCMKSLSYRLLCSGSVVVIDEWLQAGELPFFCLSVLWVSVCPFFAGRKDI